MGARIALVDSGVHARHPHLQEFGTLVLGPTVREDGTLDFESAHVDVLGHGTCVGAAILDLARDATLYSIRVFEARPECPFERVLAGLRHALDWGADVVNLSLGTSDVRHAPALLELAALARAKGARIVSPALQRGLACYPGSLPGFDGVLVDPTLARHAVRQSFLGGHVHWYAAPYPRDIPGVPRERNFAGTSLATANVSAYLARQLGSNPELETAR